MKLFLHRPGLVGRDRHHYTNLPGLPMHSQVITRSHNQCCPSSTHQPVFSSVPVRYNRYTDKLTHFILNTSEFHVLSESVGCELDNQFMSNNFSFKSCSHDSSDPIVLDPIIKSCEHP